MLDFRPIEIKDKTWLDPLIRKGDLRTSDMNFTNLFTWAGGFKGEVAENRDMLYLRFGFFDELPVYAFPVGTGDFREAVETLKRDAEEGGFPFVMRVSEGALPVLEQHFGGEYDLDSSDKWNDYIYSAQRLATLSGKKLHAKRNHIHRFEEHYSWRFEPINKSNLDECRRMCEEWFADVGDERHVDFNDEHTALNRLYDNYDVLKPEGGLIRADGQVVAITFGERLSGDTFLIHFEKSYPHIQGGYTVINREFVRYILNKYPDIQWINREEDMGLENLRKSKQSYYPDRMEVKYIARWR
jgi:hypothetical protein